MAEGDQMNHSKLKSSLCLLQVACMAEGRAKLRSFTIVIKCRKCTDRLGSQI